MQRIQEFKASFRQHAARESVDFPNPEKYELMSVAVNNTYVSFE